MMNGICPLLLRNILLCCLIGFMTSGEVIAQDRLAENGVLRKNELLVSQNNQYRFIMQGDGNLVLYDARGSALWASATAGRQVEQLIMQGDGNLVIYGRSGAVWDSKTHGNGRSTLVVQNDGNVVIYRQDGRPVWATDTQTAPNALRMNRYVLKGESLVSGNGKFRLILQGDGNLVLYDARGSALWDSGTAGKQADRLIMQGDGNLVMYGPSGALWASNTSGNGKSILAVQDDGNVVIYRQDGRPLWASGTVVSSDKLLMSQYLRPGESIVSKNGKYRLILQGDGNLVLYDDRNARWASGTAGRQADRLIMQGDGNLVMYGPSGAIWASGTSGNGKTLLAVENDGFIVIYRQDGRPVWTGPTVQKRGANVAGIPSVKERILQTANPLTQVAPLVGNSGAALIGNAGAGLSNVTPFTMPIGNNLNNASP